MKAAIVTISDGCYHQKKKDTSGQALEKLLVESQWIVAFTKIVPDDIPAIQNQLVELSENGDIDLIVTSGGTGLGPRDVTPEAVKPLLEKEVAVFTSISPGDEIAFFPPVSGGVL